MYLFLPTTTNSPMKPQRIYPEKNEETSEAVAARVLNVVGTPGTLFHRRGERALFCAYANADEGRGMWGGGRDLEPNYFAWGVLKHLGFINVERLNYYHGPIVLASTTMDTTPQHEACLKEALRLYRAEEEMKLHACMEKECWETFPKRSKKKEKSIKEKRDYFLFA